MISIRNPLKAGHFPITIDFPPQPLDPSYKLNNHVTKEMLNHAIHFMSAVSKMDQQCITLLKCFDKLNLELREKTNE